MGLPGGARIGAYEVVSQIGEGGMGAVYRGRDTRLDRDVAIKVLLDPVAADPDRLARFEREAKLLASLDHQHIAHIYGFEHGPAVHPGGPPTHALVMEFVDGQSLADRIAQAPLPIETALSIARQIAAALEAAHERGIIHRDLKPANIRLRPDGSIKVLDFGLAKLADPGPGAIEATALTSPGVTQAGLVLGTPAYMSPEQARGQALDARVDIWAFGAVLYEMLTGRRGFAGDTASDAIASVLTRDPDWTALPPHTPASLRRLLRRCLARDVNGRIRHAGDVRLELEEIAAGDSGGEVMPPPGVRTANRWLPWAVAAVASIAAIALALRTWDRAPAAAPASPSPTRLEFSLPAGMELFPSTASTLLASPDGRAIAFVGTAGGNRQLFLRRLDAFDAAPVAGTLGATTAAFSRDSRSLAFVTAGGELKVASLVDGVVSPVTTGASLIYGLTWTTADDIVFTRDRTLWTINRAGGAPRQMSTRAGNELAHAWPSALPSGQAVVFTVETASGTHVEAITVSTGERRVVLNQATRGRIGPGGRLFFYRHGRLLAAAFDHASLSVTGAPGPVLDEVAELGSGAPVGDVSESRMMVFASQAPQRRLVWVTRDGVESWMTEAPRGFMNPRVSPDGNRIVVQAGGIWIYDLRRNAFERVPSQSEAANAFPMWMPDGITVLYRSGAGVRLQGSEGGAQGRTLEGTTEFDYPGAVTPDQTTIVLNRSSPATSMDLLIAPIADPGRTTPILQTAAYEAGARLSSDGRWLAYVSNESGRNEVYVRPFLGADRRWQVSSDGGSQPVWNANSREIFYRVGDRLMTVAVTAAGNELMLAAPRQLFERSYAYGAGITIPNYDVAKDGQRFVMVREDTTVGRLRVILNWRPDNSGDAAPAR